MKKIKAILCAILLATFLVGNVFAADTTGSNGFFSYFSSAMNAIVSFFSATDNCPPRQCQTCRPTEGGDDNDPNCRPTS